MSTASPNQLLIRYAIGHPDSCSCLHPIPVARAERKGASITLCLRCGLRTPIRLAR